MIVEPRRTSVVINDDRAVEVFVEEGRDGALVLNVEAYGRTYDEDWSPRIRVYLNDALVFGDPIPAGGNGVD